MFFLARHLITATSLFVAFMGVATAQERPVVVELFTSQSCSSCVSATRVHNALANREDVVALSWHVDYWNTLNTREGAWIDPYSSQASTVRQRAYNQRLRGRSSVYTPQSVIGGVAEAVGSSTNQIDTLLAEQKKADGPIVTARRANGKIAVEVGPGDYHGNAYLVNFVPFTQTDVRRGENAGVLFEEYNIVTSTKMLGSVDRAGGKFLINPPTDNQSCAIIVQEPALGRIISARYCPS